MVEIIVMPIKIIVKISFLQTGEILYDGILQLGCYMIVAYFHFCLCVLYRFYNLRLALITLQSGEGRGDDNGHTNQERNTSNLTAIHMW